MLHVYKGGWQHIFSLLRKKNGVAFMDSHFGTRVTLITGSSTPQKTVCLFELS